jgi:hypothetical protein
VVVPLRGNVDTRLRKCRDGEVDAVVLALAGLTRLGLAHLATETFDPSRSLPAIGQGALAIVTGQQVGILGGPLYTLYKALSAVRVARTASSLLGRPVVPLFWMDADDHDFDEVRHAHLLGHSGELVSVHYEAEDGESRIPVGAQARARDRESPREASGRFPPRSSRPRSFKHSRPTPRAARSPKRSEASFSGSRAEPASRSSTRRFPP